MSEEAKLLAHTTTEHLNGKLIHIQATSQRVVVIYVCFVGVMLKRAYQI
jgi:hypothetical protein